MTGWEINFFTWLSLERRLQFPDPISKSVFLFRTASFLNPKWVNIDFRQLMAKDACPADGRSS